MSSSIITKQNLWKYYVKLSDFKAQCMFCEKKYYYVMAINFQTHITIHHKKIWKCEEERKLIKKGPWMYFKYLNELYSRCIICDVNVLSTSVENHLNTHSEKQRKNRKYRNWLWKYCRKRKDFLVECDICHKNLSLSIQRQLSYHIKVQHLDELKNTQEIHDTVASSKCVSLLETDIMSTTQNIATKNYLWAYYIKLSDYKAQCMFCKKEYYYIIATNFKTHITRHHKKIWKYEEERKLLAKEWMCFKYSNQSYSRCIICDTNVPSTFESIRNHLNLHSEEQWMDRTYRSWLWKYCTKRDNFEGLLVLAKIPLFFRRTSSRVRIRKPVAIVPGSLKRRTMGNDDDEDNNDRLTAVSFCHVLFPPIDNNCENNLQKR
nr:PREDICTED: uncharacterized protein LOC105674178 [Linepithema humile]